MSRADGTSTCVLMVSVNGAPLYGALAIEDDLRAIPEYRAHVLEALKTAVAKTLAPLLSPEVSDLGDGTRAAEVTVNNMRLSRVWVAESHPGHAEREEERASGELAKKAIEAIEPMVYWLDGDVGPHEVSERGPQVSLPREGFGSVLTITAGQALR